MKSRTLTQKLTYLLLLLCLPSCLGGASDGGFSDLIGGDLSDVDELTITSYNPTTSPVTIQVGGSQAFFIAADTPPPNSVSYYYTLDGTNVGASQTYNMTGTVPLIGNHTLVANATDGLSTVAHTWTVKVNGPPDVTGSYSTAPKVAYDNALALTVTATDPNGDPMTYAWTLGSCVSTTGSADATLVGTTNTAVFTPTIAMVGCIKIYATATDDSGASDTYSFNVEVNSFDQSCNELTQGQMCTYVGSPTLGDGFDPEDPTYSAKIKMGPIALTNDPRNENLFIADWNHNLVWYWNRTSSAVDVLQFEGVAAIPSHTIQVIAGTGAAATESGDFSLNVGINGPRGLYYDSTNDKLYISEWSGNRVKVIASNGMTSYALGVGGAHADGTAATTHACANPAGMSYYDPDGAGGVNGKLYVACYGSHRVKSWDLTTNLVDVIYGNGGAASFRNDRSLPEPPTTYGAGGTEDGVAFTCCNGTAPCGSVGGSGCGFPNPYDIFYDADGLYVTHPDFNYVRYCNFSGGAKTMFGSAVGNGYCRSIFGTGAAAFGAAGANPRTTAFREPRAITVDNDKILVSSIQGGNDRVALLNATGGNIAVGDYGVAVNTDQFQNITGVAAGYTEGAGASTKLINDPYDMIIEPSAGVTRGYLIADYSNRRVRQFNYGSNVTTTPVGSGRLRGDNFGDTGYANEFYMNTPGGIVYDSTASVQAHFIMDGTNNRIIKVDKYGNVTTVAGGGGNAPSLVNGAQGPLSLTLSTGPVSFISLAMFADKSFVFDNRGYGHFQVWNRSGSNKAYLNATTTGIDKVNQLAGNYAQANNTTPANYDDDANAMLVSLYNPSGVAISENQNTADREVFISDEYRHCIRKIDEAGALSTVVGQCKTGADPNNAYNNPANLQGGGGVGIDSDVPANHVVYRPMGLIPHYPTAADATDGGGVPASLNGDANLIIADYNGNKIRYWNRSGTSVQFASVTIANGAIETIGCTTGSSNTTENIFSQGSQCSNPIAFAMNNDYFCYSQGGKHNVRCITLTGASEGRVNTIAGSTQATTTGVNGVPYNFTKEGLAATSQKLNFPTALEFDSNGDLYISDQNNHIIKKVKMTP